MLPPTYDAPWGQRESYILNVYILNKGMIEWRNEMNENNFKGFKIEFYN